VIAGRAVTDRRSLTRGGSFRKATVGENTFVAAGAVVAEDVPPDSLAVGAPARHEPLPEDLWGGNDLP